MTDQRAERYYLDEDAPNNVLGGGHYGVWDTEDEGWRSRSPTCGPTKSAGRRSRLETSLSVLPNAPVVIARIVWDGEPLTGSGATSNAALTDLRRQIEERSS